jgi:hypothetical protein
MKTSFNLPGNTMANETGTSEPIQDSELICKITVGFVVQRFLPSGLLHDQEFVAGDDVTYEQDGESMDDPPDFYAPMLMQAELPNK